MSLPQKLPSTWSDFDLQFSFKIINESSGPQPIFHPRWGEIKIKTEKKKPHKTVAEYQPTSDKFSTFWNFNLFGSHYS